jgi:hypothetical protein
MKDKNPIQQIVEGQKATLEALHELLQGKPILFVIGAISALKGQAETVEKHIRDSYSGSFDLEMMLSDMMYRKSVVTEIVTGKRQEEDEDGQDQKSES